MLASRQTKPTIGECEVCDVPQPNTEVWLISGNIWACAAHKLENDAILASSRTVETIRQIDSQVTVKTDVMLAATVPAIELRAAIEADESIPADQKEFAYAKETYARMQHFQKVVFELRKETLANDEQATAWQREVQRTVGTLRAEHREHFKSLDMNYQPAPATKTTISKAAKDKTPKKFDKDAVFNAAKKYGVAAADVQMRVVGSNMKPENAAKALVNSVAERFKVPGETVQGMVLSNPGTTAEEQAKKLAELMGLV